MQDDSTCVASFFESDAGGEGMITIDEYRKSQEAASASQDVTLRLPLQVDGLNLLGSRSERRRGSQKVEAAAHGLNLNMT